MFLNSRAIDRLERSICHWLAVQLKEPEGKTKEEAIHEDCNEIIYVGGLVLLILALIMIRFY